MKHDDHLRIDKIIFGEEHQEVHIFLDSFFMTFRQHGRRILHHKEGLKIINSVFGKKIGDIAEFHIRADFYGKLYSVEDLKEDYNFNVERGEPIDLLIERYS